MGALKVKLVKSMSGHIESHRATLRGLGLKTLGTERIVPDNAAIRGMIKTVEYALEWSETTEAFKPFAGRPSRQARAAK